MPFSVVLAFTTGHKLHLVMHDLQPFYREKLSQKDIRNIRPTETTSSPIISTSALTTPDPFSTSTYLTSIISPVPERRPQSKYKSAEANYLALRREAVDMNQEENNYWFEMINGSLLF